MSTPDANSRDESACGSILSVDVLQLMSEKKHLQSGSDPIHKETIEKITGEILEETNKRYINVRGDLYLQIGDKNSMTKGQTEAQNSAHAAEEEGARRIGGQTNNNLQRNKGLVDAIINDDLFTMSELLKTQDGLDIIDGLSFLHVVAIYDQYKLVAPLYAFCDYGKLYRIKVGPQSKLFCGMTAIEIAVKLQHKATSNMIQVHNTYTMGLCPLHVAAKMGDLQSIDAFYSKMTKVDIRGAYGNTPLYAACVAGKLEAVKMLIDRGADVEKRNDWGDTLLHRAARWGQYDVVKFLLRTTLKNHINRKNREGWTALHMAVYYGSVSTVKLLLENKAKPNTIDVRNSSPLDTAKQETTQKLYRY
ncbi:ankyrin-3-like [Ptychodera flava]|uniref:ankyrin-3-like n=1 Tax=Ptychodera flava TaxID=63121 RepID=UPI00396AA5C2